MSDRNARPEWRAAFLNRTVTRRTLRNVAAADFTVTTMADPTPTPRTRRNADTHRDAVTTGTRGPRGPRSARRGSLALPIAAMLRLLPTA